MPEPLCNDCAQPEGMHPDIGHPFRHRPEGLDRFIADPTVPEPEPIPDQSEVVEYGEMIWPDAAVADDETEAS